MKKGVYLVLFVLCCAVGRAQSADDRAGIERAILNYVEAFYEADTAKAYASVATDLAKRGYYRQNGQVNEAKMSFDQLVQLSKRWKNSQKITPESPKKITILDVLDTIASAKVEALWGIDYFHLAKVNGSW
ncbi:MAG TPA: nuclear transport factor 2 family protein, partial [Chitinophagaceae bacterium]|nr:nuclear transport factor 2 family protein [Chitinophagaceae bacterium]